MGGSVLMRRFVAALLSLLMVAPAIGSSAPVAAAAGPDPVTVIALDSQPGEYNGRGHPHTYVEPDLLEAYGDASAVRLRGLDSDGEHRIELAPPVGEPWAMGAFENATGAGGTSPRIDLVSGTSACTNGTGRFEVLELPTFDVDGKILTFAAEFEHRCNTSETMHGSIRIGSSVPLKALDISPIPLYYQLDLGGGTVAVANAPVPVTITNVGNVPTSLDGVTATADVAGSFIPALDCPASLDPGASCTLNVTFQPFGGGLIRGDVIFTSDALRWGWPITLRGVGTFADGPNATPGTAIVIGSLPFAHAGNIGYGSGGGSGSAECLADQQSLWYRYTTATRQRVKLDPTGSQQQVAILVMAGSSDVQPFACSANTPLTFTAEAGVSYWIKVQGKYSFSTVGQGIVLRATEGAADGVVDATGVGISATAFYPYVDGYRDTILIRGTRGEKASVAIRVYSSASKLVRAFTVPVATGAYSVTWNGKTSGGAALASGTYRIVQLITDQWGNQLSTTSSTTISLKRLYTYTYSKTLDAARYSATGKAGSGSYSKTATSYAGGVKLSTGSKAGAAAVGYAFSVPSATIYKSITFSALGRGNAVTGGTFDAGVHDWTLCSGGWSVNCVDSWGGGPRDYGWAGHKVVGNRHVSATRIVRTYLQVTGYATGVTKWADVRDVKMTVVYGILK